MNNKDVVLIYEKDLDVLNVVEESDTVIDMDNNECTLIATDNGILNEVMCVNIGESIMEQIMSGGKINLDYELPNDDVRAKIEVICDDIFCKRYYEEATKKYINENGILNCLFEPLHRTIKAENDELINKITRRKPNIIEVCELLQRSTEILSVFDNSLHGGNYVINDDFFASGIVSVLCQLIVGLTKLNNHVKVIDYVVCNKISTNISNKHNLATCANKYVGIGRFLYSNIATNKDIVKKLYNRVKLLADAYPAIEIFKEFADNINNFIHDTPHINKTLYIDELYYCTNMVKYSFLFPIIFANDDSTALMMVQAIMDNVMCDKDRLTKYKHK